MRYEEVANVIKSAGFPCAYRTFPPNSTDKVPPYIVYYYTGSDDVYADNINYQEINGMRIELYTRNKDFAAEKALETALRNADISWVKDETFVDSENMYLIIYESEVLINGE